MHIGADVLLLHSDVHVELEDDDHDVIDVISPLSFKVGMNNPDVGLGDGQEMMTHLVGEIVFDVHVDEC